MFKLIENVLLGVLSHKVLPHLENDVLVKFKLLPVVAVGYVEDLVVAEIKLKLQEGVVSANGGYQVVVDFH